MTTIMAHYAHGRLPDEATELATGLAGTLEGICSPATVRAAWPAGDPAIVAQMWRRLADTGLFDSFVPVMDGGLGLTELHLVAAMEEAGYAAVPGPLIETVAIVAPLLSATGTNEYVARVRAGSTYATVTRPGSELVPYAQLAEFTLAAEDGHLSLYRCHEAVTAVPTVDGSRQGGFLSAAAPIFTADLEPAAWEEAMLRATLAAAAQLLGLARRMMAITIPYVARREQFGHPIGSFQAVKHLLADCAIGVEFARPLVHTAAWSMARGDHSAARDVSAAKARAGEVAAAVARRTIQAHGAMAYTTEYDLHLFAKRAWALAADWGTNAEHRDRVARALGL
jgi:alkylation response protein AidB-like acyl-CoA dehydrogenase